MWADYYTALHLINCPPLLKAGPGTDPGFSVEMVRINVHQKSTILGGSRGMLPQKNFDIQVLRMVISCILKDNKTTPSLAILNMNYS